MTIAETEQTIANVLNTINSGSYFRSTTEVQTAALLSNTQLYQKFRGNMAQYQKNSPKAVLNFGETTITLDSLAELFRIIPISGNPLVVSLSGQTVDVVENIDVKYDGDFMPSKILPPNQYRTMNQNLVITPDEEFPVTRFFEMTDPDQFQTFQIVPSGYTEVEASVFILPTPPVFTFSDSGGAIPTILATIPFVWTSEKIPALVNLMIENLGFTLQNGVLIQGAQAQLQQQL
jgi:hypothetical protein